MRPALLFVAAIGLALAPQAFAQDGEQNAYNTQPADSYNVLGASAVNAAGTTLSHAELSQSVSGTTVGSSSQYSSGGLNTGGVNGSTLSSANGLLVQSTNTGIGSNIGSSTAVSAGSISLP